MKNSLFLSRTFVLIIKPTNPLLPPTTARSLLHPTNVAYGLNVSKSIHYTHAPLVYLIYAVKNTYQSVVIRSLSTISRFQINTLPPTPIFPPIWQPLDGHATPPTRTNHASRRPPTAEDGHETADPSPAYRKAPKGRKLQASSSSLCVRCLYTRHHLLSPFVCIYYIHCLNVSVISVLCRVGLLLYFVFTIPRRHLQCPYACISFL